MANAYICRIAWIVGLECSWDRNGRGRSRTAAASNINLRTADIKLFPSVKRRRNDLSSQDLVNAYLGRCAGVVDPELLNSEEVFAVGDAFWDAGRVRV